MILLESTSDYHLEFTAEFNHYDPFGYVTIDDILIDQAEYCQGKLKIINFNLIIVN